MSDFDHYFDATQRLTAKVEKLKAELAAEAARREKAEREADDCSDLCAEIDADSPDACIREVQYMRRDLQRLEDERDAARARVAVLEGLLRECLGFACPNGETPTSELATRIDAAIAAGKE